MPGRQEDMSGMFRKYAAVLAAFSTMSALAWLCVRGADVDRYIAATAFVPEIWQEEIHSGQAVRVQSLRPMIGLEVLEQKPKYELSAADYDALLKIVEAEAGCEDETGKLLVANVVLNRVNSEDFPDTVSEVVYQRQGEKAQFSPVGNGSIQRIKPSEETVAAVNRAVMGEDISQGALYFASRKAADPKNMDWFDRNLTRLFAYGGHEFFG